MIAIRNILFACLAIVLLVITLVASADAMPTNSLSGDALAKNRTALAQVESKLRALEIAIAEAKSNGVPTEMPEVTATTARQFLKWIDWDINHPDRLTECISQWWVIQSRSNELATAIPGQEIADTVEILDRALVELTDAHRLRAVPDFSGTRLHHFNGHWFAGNRPVFPGGLIWMPESREIQKAFGSFPSVYLTLRDGLRADGTVKSNVVSNLKQRIADYERRGIPFDVFLDHNPPSWAVKKFPKITEGSRQFAGYDIDHPQVREMWKRNFGAVVPVIRNEAGGLATYMLANEPHWFTTKGMWSTGTVSEYTFRHFRKWLARRYNNDLALLNRRWQTHFASFDAVVIDLPLSRSVKGSAVWYDWCRFNMDRVNDWFSFLAAEIKKNDPQAQCHIKLMADLWYRPEFGCDHGIDFETLTAQVQDTSGADTAAEAWGDDFSGE